jgi:hypothetical protein
MDTSAGRIPEIARRALTEPNPTAGARREVSTAEAESFARRLQDEGGGAAAAQPSSAPGDDNASNAALPLGDTILNGLKHAGVEFENQWNALKGSVSATQGQVTLTQLLRMQMQMFELEHQAQFTATVVKKTSAAIDQALHTQ